MNQSLELNGSHRSFFAPRTTRGSKKKKKVFSSTQAVLDRLEKCLSENILLINRSSICRSAASPEAPCGWPTQKFTVSGATGSVYDVTIGRCPSCTCPDFASHSSARADSYLCKHALFILVEVLRIKTSSAVLFRGTLELAELEAIFTQAQMRLSRQSGLTTTAMPSSFSSFPSSVRVPSSGPVRHHDDETEDGRLPPPPPRAPLAPSVPPSTQGAHGGDHHSDQTRSHNNIIDLTDDSSPVGIGMPTSSRSSSVIIPSCKGAKEGIMHNRKRPRTGGQVNRTSDRKGGNGVSSTSSVVIIDLTGDNGDDVGTVACQLEDSGALVSATSKAATRSPSLSRQQEEVDLDCPICFEALLIPFAGSSSSSSSGSRSSKLHHSRGRSGRDEQLTAIALACGEIANSRDFGVECCKLCRKAVHVECLDLWFMTSRTCCYCRAAWVP